MTVLPVKRIPDIKKDDDLAKIIVSALESDDDELQKGDILVIAQKVVSKAEGRTQALSSVKPSAFAIGMARAMDKDPRHLEIILRESKNIVRMRGGHLITETRHGFICANSGVDMSNVGKGGEEVTLLPKDPDVSAERIRSGIRRVTGLDVPVVITDTFGRAWRLGHVNFAIGVSGLKPIKDYRGTRDMYRRVLRVTEIAVADELASAGELVMNKADRVPVAIIRGYGYARGRGSAQQLVRPEELDLFR
ncbi:MAG: coenzyme F420-0:L-glutamate ligase [Crenarchaeota archaeon 13_1_40CM_3_53_5]|nr:MAG: coenzyme F420-0:L-glutamate ligase [Crenarchaeota archaeon 13_1_40CM_3_53_5]